MTKQRIIGLVLTTVLLMATTAVFAVSNPAVFKRITNLQAKGLLILDKGEYIFQASDDNIEFQGASGSDDTDFNIDLDGTHPVLSCPTDSGIEVSEPLGTTAGSVSLGAGVTTFAVTSNVMTVTGHAGANSITTITGGVSGQTLTLIGVDGLVTYVDDNTHAANTIDLVGVNEVSADDEVTTLVFDGTSWYQSAATVSND